MHTLRLYSYAASPNCLKVRILLAHLNRPHERIETDIFAGDTMSETYTAMNPARLTPLLVIGHRQHLPESSAILWYLAEGSSYLPTGALERADVLRWLLFEQSDVAYGIAGLRFRLRTGLLTERDPNVAERRRRGEQALAILEDHLRGRNFLVGESYTIADIANYAYVHVASEAGYELDATPSVSRWIERVEQQHGFVSDLAPLPEDPGLGRGLSIYG